MTSHSCCPVRFAVLALALLVALPALAKRAPPTDVAPVVDGNMRYEVPHFPNPCGQLGGCVVAYDNGSNAVLWSVQVYCTRYDSDMETDVQDVFITSLTVADGRVSVANEAGQHFTIDPISKQVAGDATGCDGGGSGCNVHPAEPVGVSSTAVVVLGLLTLLAGKRRG